MSNEKTGWLQKSVGKTLYKPFEQRSAADFLAALLDRLFHTLLSKNYGLKRSGELGTQDSRTLP